MIGTIGQEKDWPPTEIGGLFCDRHDYRGIYWWYDKFKEKKKFSRLKKGETMQVTYEHLDGQ